MIRVRHLAAAAFALTLAVPGLAQAQQPPKPWIVEVSGAYVIPSGDYNALVKNGWGANAFVGYELNPQFVVAGNFNAYWMASEFEIAGDWTNYSYFAMVGFNAAGGVAQGDGYVVLGAGGMTFSQDGGESNTNFALSGGFRSYFYFSESVGLSIDAMATVAFTPADTFTGTTWFFPLGAGLVFRF
jgi:hypothetical protein